MFPQKKNYKSKSGLCQITAEWLNCVENMLDGLVIEMIANQDHAEIVSPNKAGDGWKFKIPSGGGDELPSNANSSKGTIIVTSADNVAADDDPDLWTLGSFVTGITVNVGGIDQTIMLRELDMCVNGVAKKMLIFASDVY